LPSCKEHKDPLTQIPFLCTAPSASVGIFRLEHSVVGELYPINRQKRHVRELFYQHCLRL